MNVSSLSLSSCLSSGFTPSIFLGTSISQLSPLSSEPYSSSSLLFISIYTLAMPSHAPPIFLQSHIPFSSLLSWPNLWKETSTAVLSFSPHPMHSSAPYIWLSSLSLDLNCPQKRTEEKRMTSLSFNPLDATQSSICLTSSSIRHCHTLPSLPNTLFSCLPWPTFQLPSTSLVNASQFLCWWLLLCLSSSVGSIPKVLIFGPPCYRCCTLFPYDLIPLMTVSSLIRCHPYTDNSLIDTSRCLHLTIQGSPLYIQPTDIAKSIPTPMNFSLLSPTSKEVLLLPCFYFNKNLTWYSQDLS